MDKLIQLAKRAAKLNENKNTLINHVLSIKEVQDLIIWLNQEVQLFQKGINADGDIIGFYSLSTQLINPQKVAGTPYTLKDTGAFFDSFNIELGENEIYITANPIKGKDNLFEKYGEDILGLTNESKDILSIPVQDFLMEKVKAYLQNS